MGDRGGIQESARLKKSIEDQLTRLAQQLSDIEENKDDFTPEEYEAEMKATLSQIEDFKAMAAADITLVSKAADLQHQIQDHITFNRDPNASKHFAKLDSAAKTEMEAASRARDDSVRSGFVSATATGPSVNPNILDTAKK